MFFVEGIFIKIYQYHRTDLRTCPWRYQTFQRIAQQKVNVPCTFPLLSTAPNSSSSSSSGVIVTIPKGTSIQPRTESTEKKILEKLNNRGGVNEIKWSYFSIPRKIETYQAQWMMIGDEPGAAGGRSLRYIFWWWLLYQTITGLGVDPNPYVKLPISTEGNCVVHSIQSRNMLSTQSSPFPVLAVKKYFLCKCTWRTTITRGVHYLNNFSTDFAYLCHTCHELGGGDTALTGRTKWIEVTMRRVTLRFV